MNIESIKKHVENIDSLPNSDSLESIGMKKTKAINITTANEVEKQRI